MLKIKDGGPDASIAASGGLQAAARGGLPGVRADGDVFSFTIEAGAVTDASVQTRAGTMIDLPSPEGLSYSVQGETVVATMVHDASTVTRVYSDTDDDGLYEVVASSRVMTQAPDAAASGPGGAHTVTVTLDAAKTDVLEVSRTGRGGNEITIYSSTEAQANANVSVDWSVQQGLVVQTVTTADGHARYEIYRDGNADGVYTQVATGTGTMPELVGVVAATDAFATVL